MGSERDLVAPEGVDEGSAASTVEDERSGSGGVLGAPGQGVPADPEQDAAPVPIDAPDVPRPGQQQQVGER